MTTKIRLSCRSSRNYLLWCIQLPRQMPRSMSFSIEGWKNSCRFFSFDLLANGAKPNSLKICRKSENLSFRLRREQAWPSLHWSDFLRTQRFDRYANRARCGRHCSGTKSSEQENWREHSLIASNSAWISSVIARTVHKVANVLKLFISIWDWLKMTR